MRTRGVLALTTVIGSLLVAQAAFAQQTTTTFSQKPFIDVPTTHTNYEAIEYLRKNNVLKGYADGSFRPNNRINRAEFVKLIANPFLLSTERLDQCISTKVPPTSPTVFFNDVQRDAWYGAEVCLAYTKGLVKGYADSTFRPGSYINFVETAKILSLVFSLSVEEKQGEDWFVPYVQKLSDLHAIPTSIRHFGDTITRGQMAEMMYRLKAHRTDKPSLTASQLSQ